MAAVTEDNSRNTLGVVVKVSLAVLLTAVVALVAYTFGVTNEVERGNKAALEVDRQTAERELRYDAEANEKPVANINVVVEDGKLIATWQEGGATCKAVARPPSEQGGLWRTDPVEQGSGGCTVKPGSPGLGNSE